MLYSGVTREWMGEGELPKERTQSEVVEALRCLDCSSAHIRLREPDKSKDKAEMEVDSEEYHNAVEVNLPIAKKGT
ncbi:hypothetical protein BHE74_00028668 [Ensete ventricosum]|uniref:Uncharacterized protein n=1 Tax=Ensete ventricosum TaxID=4639 RepID=A0A444F7M9_ENSVE|nr:hypothetical protein B296_00017759 [Ensete ventricosum]RWW18596.1 hypothetical protein GW17_00017407 [Ensete ventricosum]RWW64111.1 hypothetical protein BHE74_00028668 [Ensete ventricosum]